MAYKTAFNPDALPAHAEPEQAAQLLGSGQPPRAGQKPGQNQRQNQTPSPNSGVPPHRVSPSNLSQGYKPPEGYKPPGRPGQTQQPYSGRNDYAQSGPPPPGPAPARVNYQNVGGSPPPQGYGFGPPPANPAQNRPSSTARPTRTQPPPANVPVLTPSDEAHELFPLFRAANASNSGSLSESELSSALVNGDYTSFDPYTVTMMVRMFDRDGNGTVGFDEFVGLWRFLAAWRELFERFDEDRSGRISLQEFGKALVSFGYRLSQPFVGVLFTTFESKARGKPSPTGELVNGMSFDLFVQACITLKRMTDVFKQYDSDRDGYITLSFEEFLGEVLKLRS